MDLKDIMSIPGKHGLFKTVLQNKNVYIVESLIDKRRIPVIAADKANPLEDISIFTNIKDKDVKLPEVMDLIYKKESGGPCIDSKSDDAKLKKYFEEVLPDYNKEKVYASDIKKMLSWYNLLHSLGILKMEEEKKEETPEKDTEVKTDTTEEK